MKLVEGKLMITTFKEIENRIYQRNKEKYIPPFRSPNLKTTHILMLNSYAWILEIFERQGVK